jgi:hypothetical protein
LLKNSKTQKMVLIPENGLNPVIRHQIRVKTKKPYIAVRLFAPLLGLEPRTL